MKKIFSIAFILIGLVAHAQTPVLGPGGNIVSVPLARDITDTLVAKVWNRKGIVLSATVAGEESNIYEPTIIRDVNSQLLGVPSTDTVFKMWYTGGWLAVNIYYAESPNGYPGTWIKRSTAVLTGRSRSFILKNGSTFYMYSVSGNPSTAVDQHTSTDGVTWTLAHANVITAAMLGVTRIDNTSVLIDGSTWQLMVEGASGSRYSINYFSSTDGFTFTQPFTNPVITGQSNGGPWLTKIGSTYYLWCHGVGGLTGVLPTDAYIYKSTDLHNWQMSPEAFILRRRGADEGEGTIGGQVADLALLTVKDSVYCYYSASADGGVITGNLHIKLAVAPIRFDSLVKSTQNDVSYKNHDLAVGNEVIRGLPGSVLFVGKSNKLQASYSKLFYDEGTGFLGIGTGLPAYPVHVKYNTIGNARFGFFNDTTGFNQTDIAIGKSTLANTMFFGANYGNTQNTYIQDKSGAFNLLFLSGSTSVAALRSSGFEIYGATPINFARPTNTTLSRIAWSTAGTNDFLLGQRGQAGSLNDLSLSKASGVSIFQIGATSGNIYFGDAYDVSINPVAKLEVASTTKGILLPSMSRTLFNAITPTNGLLGYDNVLKKFVYSDGTTTRVLLDSASATSGGSGITALTGDVTASGTGSVAATLATVNSNVGSFTAANITVDAKGRITAAANGSAGGGITALTGDATASGTGSQPITLATVNSNTGSFGSATTIPIITLNGKGLATAASTATIPSLASATYNTAIVTGTSTNLSSVAAVVGYYMKMGNYIQMGIDGSFTPTGAGFTEVDFTLPFSTTLAANTMIGVGSLQDATGANYRVSIQVKNSTTMMLTYTATTSALTNYAIQLGFY